MFTRHCKKCGKEFHLKDARVDEHWNGYSLEPAHCYCPYCDEVLDGVLPSSVDTAKTLNLRFFVVFVAISAIGSIAAATEALKFVGTGGIIVFGAYLAKYGSTRDHRYIGWFLAVAAIVIYSAVEIYT